MSNALGAVGKIVGFPVYYPASKFAPLAAPLLKPSLSASGDKNYLTIAAKTVLVFGLASLLYFTPCYLAARVLPLASRVQFFLNGMSLYYATYLTVLFFFQLSHNSQEAIPAAKAQCSVDAFLRQENPNTESMKALIENPRALRQLDLATCSETQRNAFVAFALEHKTADGLTQHLISHFTTNKPTPDLFLEIVEKKPAVAERLLEKKAVERNQFTEPQICKIWSATTMLDLGKKLIEKEFAINSKDPFGKTPLILALTKWIQDPKSSQESISLLVHLMTKEGKEVLPLDLEQEISIGDQKLSLKEWLQSRSPSLYRTLERATTTKTTPFFDLTGGNAGSFRTRWGSSSTYAYGDPQLFLTSQTYQGLSYWAYRLVTSKDPLTDAQKEELKKLDPIECRFLLIQAIQADRHDFFPAFAGLLAKLSPAQQCECWMRLRSVKAFQALRPLLHEDSINAENASHQTPLECVADLPSTDRMFKHFQKYDYFKALIGAGATLPDDFALPETCNTPQDDDIRAFITAQKS